MWILNSDINKWVRTSDVLSKDNYDNIKEDISKVKLYSKTLSGTNYMPVSDVSNIYEPLFYKDNKSWFISPAASIYNSSSYLPTDGVAIDKDSISNYKKYISEYGFTLNNSFSPEKSIEDNLYNFLGVDLTTTESILLTTNIIDGITLKENNVILVKNQITKVDLSFSVDPNTYFTGNYYFIENDGTSNKYYYYNSENGIYVFKNNKLVKTVFDSYEEYSGLTIYVRSGSNIDEQYSLSRNLKGFYPTNGEASEFKNSHNWIVRNRVDYHNLYENNYFDILKHATQSYIKEGFTYTIPERLVYIGDFGIILINEGVESMYIHNDFKYNLKSVSEVDGFYWMCGNEGSLLKISKVNFEITKINLNELNNLTSISFYDNNRGILVGKYNTIYYTIDSGVNWNKLAFEGTEGFSYNNVLFYSYDKIFISGENGLFVELNYSESTSGKWSYIKRNILKKLTKNDEYELIEDINSMYYSNFQNWNLTYSNTGVNINISKDCLMLGTLDNLIIYDINNFISEHDFIYFSWSQSVGDIRAITSIDNDLILSGDNTFKFNLNQVSTISNISNFVLPMTYSVLYSDYNNKIFNYNNTIYNVGNIGLSKYYNGSYSEIDNTLKERYVPKMLFLDYSVANKLNFFDSNYNYRLPEPIIIKIYNGLTANNISSLMLNSGEGNCWIDYLVDSYKTYGVNSDTSSYNYVLLNTKFSMTQSVVTFSNSEITINANDMLTLYPNIKDTTKSKYLQFTPTIPTNSFKLFVHNNIIIFKLPHNFAVVGDMIRIFCNLFETNVLINYVFSDFAYAFSDLNQNMINSIASENEVKISNLNKYSDYSDLLTNFEYHPISDGYKLDYDRENIIISARFNNLTAYKSMELNVTTKYFFEYVSTIVGASTSGYLDGSFDVAKILRPSNIAFVNNNVYVTEGGTNSSYIEGVTQSYRDKVRKLDITNSLVSTFASGLFDPTGICGDNLGNIYFTEIHGNYIKKISISGVVTIIAGDGTEISSGDGGLAINSKVETPFGIAVNSFGEIYFIEKYRLRKISNGHITTIAGTGSYGFSGDDMLASHAIFNSPNHLSIDKYNNIYITDNGNHRIRKIDYLTNIISTFVGNGINGFSGDGGLCTNAKLSYPAGTIFDKDNNFYVCDFNNNRIRKIGTDNIIKTIVGSGVAPPHDIHDNDGYSPLLTNIRPHSLCIDSIGNLYFTDLYSSKVRKIKYSNHGLFYSSDAFNKFKFKPNYNINDFLTNISNSFINKKFSCMPEYNNLPGNNGNSYNDSNIYIDTNSNNYPKNKLIFGKNLKFEYDTIWINTFVNIELITSGGTFVKNELLVIKKYYDNIIGGWAIEFSDRLIDSNGYNVSLISIISRNKLSEISLDLAKFDNVNSAEVIKSYNNGLYNFKTFDYNKHKINTDSYAKILLSDGDIKEKLNSIIYINSKGNLILDVINIGHQEKYKILNSFNINGKVGVNIEQSSNIKNDSLVFINFTGGTFSSKDINPSYIGMHTINKIDNNNYLTSINKLNTTYSNDIGELIYFNYDPFFNYEPIDLLEVGVNNKFKIPISLNNENIFTNGLTLSLVNFETPTFRLVDGLDIDTLSKYYHWILEAEISDAIIGIDSNGIVWYSGVWHSGRWFGGTWYSGIWISGDWYGGDWHSYVITDRVNHVDVGTINTINKSVWYNGRWFNGNWHSGKWFNGRWYSGVWSTGIWYNGIWNDGSWVNGEFVGGIWVTGKWNSGIFNSSNKPSYWINGKFISGDFQNGMWYNGQFGENTKVLSKFGSLSTNSRNATWQGGVWLSGNFYSYENLDINGKILISNIHKYSIWKTGIFNQGNFWGGIVYNIEFQNGNWYGGIVKDIQIIGISNPLDSNEITLNGIFRFNIGNYVNIINNGINTSYINLGNDNSPGKYRVALVRYDLINNWTILTLDYNFSDLNFDSPFNTSESFDIKTGLSCVSKFKNIIWTSGVWTNGIFEGGEFKGGIWLNGIFSGEWGI